MLNMSGLRLPADTPIVSVSSMLMPKQVVLIDGAQFADDRRRAVIGADLTAETATAIEESLIEHERIDGMRRWVSDMLAHKPIDLERNDG